MTDEIEMDETIHKVFVPLDLTDVVYSDEELEEKENEEFELEKQKHFENSGIGSKYFEKRMSDFDAYNDELKDNLNDVLNYIESVNFGENRQLWMCGKNGNGKTLLASQIVRECWGKYAESSIIEDEIEQTKHYSAKESLTALRERYASYRLLVIDEVGRFPSDNEKKYLFKILNDRYNADKPTVLITNMNVEQLKEYLGRGLVDRAIESCKTVSFNSPSYRQKERSKNQV